MAEAMEIDRYVRTGTGDPRRWMSQLGTWRWETRDMRALVDAIRDWNKGKAAGEQIGFYGFEIPTAEHAVSVVTSLPDSVLGKPLKAWLVRQYACVAVDEGAHWGLEGRAADSTYWNACMPATSTALDSIVALRVRLGASPRNNGDLAFAEEMARLVQHHVRVGLRHLARQEGNAEHVMYLADLIGANSTLLVWGGDFEMGRLAEKTNVQTGMALGTRLGERYRPIAFGIGGGVVRTRSASAGQRGGQPSGLTNVTVAPPLPETYEDAFSRAGKNGFWLDTRRLPSGAGGAWLTGPRNMRLITEVYSAAAPDLFETPIEFPKFFDAVVFVQRVSPTRQ
jgi:erythromycin esterase-like protein